MLLKNLHGKRIILASQSPRRQELVKGLELEPVIVIREVDESYPEHIQGPDVAAYVTRKKAEAYLLELEENDVLITGDTVVLLGKRVFEKPQNVAEAKEMLRTLSGKTHTVASGIAVTTLAQGIRVEVDTCEVTFVDLSDELIDHYIEAYAPFDKAGSYGVQDLMGFAGVERINGSYYTVMGLPTLPLFRLLESVEGPVID
ncbi:MAG: Maf family protein [Flavobacteriales bacterium]|nr:Maf family protein [Flavobacteriales bacterium]